MVGETTCDGKKKAYELLGEMQNVYVMELPQMKRPKDVAFCAPSSTSSSPRSRS